MYKPIFSILHMENLCYYALMFYINCRPMKRFFSYLALFFTGSPCSPLACWVSPPRLLPPDFPHRPTGFHHHHHHRRRYATFCSDTRWSRDLADKYKIKIKKITHEKLSGCCWVELHSHFKRHLTFSPGCCCQTVQKSWTESSRSCGKKNMCKLKFHKSVWSS